LVKRGGGRIAFREKSWSWMKLDKSELVRFKVLKAMVADDSLLGCEAVWSGRNKVLKRLKTTLKITVIFWQYVTSVCS
jgi:hypothetical protein